MDGDPELLDELAAKPGAHDRYRAFMKIHVMPAGAGRMFWGWIGLGLVTVSGWLGGELIETLGISVHENANPDAPSSLSEGREARRTESRRRVPVHREV